MKMVKHVKKLLAGVLALALVCGLTGCGGESDPASTNSGEGVKPVLLVVSFGTSYNESRDTDIGAVEAALQEAYPDYEVRRAFTSQIIIDILAEREGLEIDNVTQAMERLVADGVKEVVIQPTHIMPGFEYNDLVNESQEYADQFDSLKVGQPLLSSDEDYDRVAAALVEATADYDVDGTAVVFMGHGTEHEANTVYSKLQQKLIDAGQDNYFIGTVEATPTLEDVMALVRESGATRVVLRPMMIVAGDHASNDMAGDEEDSWKSAFTAAGYEVECVLEGLGRLADIQQIFVDHAGAEM